MWVWRFLIPHSFQYTLLSPQSQVGTSTVVWKHRELLLRSRWQRVDMARMLLNAITHHGHIWPLSTAQVSASRLPKITPLPPTEHCFNSFLESFKLPLLPNSTSFILCLIFLISVSEILFPCPYFPLNRSYLSMKLWLKCYLLQVNSAYSWSFPLCPC